MTNFTALLQQGTASAWLFIPSAMLLGALHGLEPGRLKEVTLGAALVVCFSIGLALTLVLSGASAAIGARHVARTWPGFGEIARRAPYVSGILIIFVGVYVGYQGYAALHQG